MENHSAQQAGTEKVIGKNFKEFVQEYRVEKAKDDFFYKVSTLVIASFGLVAALAWEDAAKDLFQYLFGSIGTLHAKIIYALLATLIAVIISLILRRMVLKKASKESEDPTKN